MKFMFKLVSIFAFIFAVIYFSLNKLANLESNVFSNESRKEQISELSVKALPKKLSYESIANIKAAMDQITFEESDVVLHLGEYLDPDEMLDSFASSGSLRHLGEYIDPDTDMLISRLTSPLWLGEFIDPSFESFLLDSASELVELGDYMDVDTFFLDIPASNKVQHLGEIRDPEEH